MTTRKVKVIRAFYFNRLVQKIDSVVELPSVFAAEMIAARKAEPYQEPVVLAPVVTQETGDGKGKKEARDAGK